MTTPVLARNRLRCTTVVALMLMVSVLYVAASDSTAQVSAAEAVDPTTSTGAAPHGPDDRGVAGRSWDWAAYADDDGFVDVILMVSPGAGTGGPTKAFSVGAGLPFSPGLARAVEDGVSRRYSHAVDGVAARLSVDVLRSIQAEAPTVGLYPDLEVRTSSGDSIGQVGADRLWSLRDDRGSFVTGLGVVVAVVDTGVCYSHPDLGGGIGPGFKVLGGYDFRNDDPDPADDNGHGTHVAGIVAASGGISGVAPGANILAYKVLGNDGYGLTSDVIAGIDAAMDPNGDGDTSDHADIISLSLGAQGYQGDPLCLAVRSAVGAGAVVVVAAGNDGPSMGTVSSPGLEAEAITVGAVDASGQLAPFSSRGTTPDTLVKPELSAPGVDILSTVPYSGAAVSSPTGYMSLSGTSMAAPHVSGAAALVLQLHPGWTPEQVKSALITESSSVDEPLWHAGAGTLWVPSAAEATLFTSHPVVSYGYPNGVSQALSISNGGTESTFTSVTHDFQSLWYDGLASSRYWSNSSYASPSTVAIPSGGAREIGLTVAPPPESCPEGYYEGAVIAGSSDRQIRIAFGFVALSRLDVRVVDIRGNEVSDSRGAVFVYGLPGGTNSQFAASTPSKPSPPASFLLPSGSYSAHALGHHLFYSYTDPYVLSGEAPLGRFETVVLYLRMAEARKTTLDMETEDGVPIYVKDFMMYCAYLGDTSVSIHVVAADSTVTGTDVFTLPRSRSLYISDTSARVGVFASGFSYSADMWDFIGRNWDHWYEFIGSTSTDFLVPSTADLQFLLSWEFDGVDHTMPAVLGVDEDRCSVFETKYDILGGIGDVWGRGGSHLSMGGETTPYQRRPAFTAINPVFSGMTRTIVAQGVYSEIYWPGSLTDAYLEPEYYIPDLTRRVGVVDLPNVYLADRAFLTPVEGASESVRIGAGPFYPSARTLNSESSFLLVHPLLRDQGGARVASSTTPNMYITRDGSVIGSYRLVEHQGDPCPMREVPLVSNGRYQATITVFLDSQVSSSARIVLGFTKPSADMNPPEVRGLTMPQRFVPGDAIPVEISAADDVALAGLEAWWKPSAEADWRPLAVREAGAGTYATSIQTGASDRAVDLRFNVSDSSGNYLLFTTSNAALEQVPIDFALSLDADHVGYIDGDASVLVTGRLTGPDGNPLSSVSAVPIELMLGDRKIAMILDEYVTDGAHSHNGEIRYEWHFNPARLFTSPDQTIEILASVDLGTYSPAYALMPLTSFKTGSCAPIIRLLSPANGSVIATGATIDLSVWDDGSAEVEAYLDGTFLAGLESPWDIDTAAWAEGVHTLRVVATDDEGLRSSATFTFDADASPPSVLISYPTDGAHVPQGSVLTAHVTDAHLSSVRYSLDGQPPVGIAEPYEVDMSGWEIGGHVVDVSAVDAAGHESFRRVSFTIVEGEVAVTVVSPGNGSVVNSGVPIVLSVVGEGAVVSKWREDGDWLAVGPDNTIPTIGWSEGLHNLVVNASNDDGDSDEYVFAITIDDTPPDIILDSPSPGSFVHPDSEILIRVVDSNRGSTSYVLGDAEAASSGEEITVSLGDSVREGCFELRVWSVDLAGNAAAAEFSFVMDRSTPTISVEGVCAGGSIRPGVLLEVTAADSYLESVEWSLDGGPAQPLDASNAIDTSSFTDGWHVLTSVARDMSGWQTSLPVPMYVDSQPPSVAVMLSGNVSADRAIGICAAVSDDYGVNEVVLLYELCLGGYGSAVMSLAENGTYRAELSAELLWEGMTVRVVGEDRAGNIGESPALALSAVPGTDGPAPPSTPGEDDDDAPLGVLMSVVAAALAAIALVGVLVTRSRGRRHARPGLRASGHQRRPRMGAPPR